MQTVVQFAHMGLTQRRKNGGKNRIFSRSLRKIAFIDNRYALPDSPDYPAPGETWLVEIVRENQGKNGGCFIVQPIQKLSEDDVHPLIHGMYSMHEDGDAVVLVPRDRVEGKYWSMSPNAVKAIQEAYGDQYRSVVIDHGGGMWNRRKPPEDVLASSAQRILREVQDS